MHPERRYAPRFAAQLEISVDGGSGLTSNFSSHGMYFTTPLPLSPGQAISIQVPFPHVAPGTRASCAARVLRVETLTGSYGIAANYDSIGFESTPPH